MIDLRGPVEEQARQLLREVMVIGDWAKTGDPRAKPYLDGGAVRLVDGNAEFHRDEFIKVYVDQLLAASR